MVQPDPRARRRSRVGGWPIVIVGLVLVLLAYQLRYALIPFVFAAMIGFVLDPLVAWAAGRMGGHRWPAATMLTVLFVALVGGGGAWVGRRSVQEIGAALHRLPHLLDAALTAIAGPQGITFLGTRHSPQDLTALIINGATHVINAAQVLLALKLGMGAIAALILTLVLVPYFLVSGPKIARGAIWLVPPERRRSVEDMLPVLVPMLRRYAVGLCCVVIYATAVAYVGLGPIFGIPGAPLLSLIVGLLELIPVVGPITSMALIALAGVGAGGFSILWLMAYALALRLSIDNLVGPFALGRSARVHPVVVIFGFVLGAVLFGVIGLLLAVPTAASIRLILQHYYAEPIARDDGRAPDLAKVRRPA